MTQTKYIAGGTGVFGSIARTVFLIVAAMGSIFLLVTGAVVAFFVLAALITLSLAAFTFFWAKAKVTGKPFGPKAQFEKARQDMESQFKAYKEQMDGPVLDAQKTPDGWSVED